MPRLGVSGGAPSRTILRPRTQEKQMNLEKKKELILSEPVFYMAALQCENLILNQRKYDGFD